MYTSTDQGKIYKVVQWTTSEKNYSEVLAIWQPFKHVSHISLLTVFVSISLLDSYKMCHFNQ